MLWQEGSRLANPWSSRKRGWIGLGGRLETISARPVARQLASLPFAIPARARFTHPKIDFERLQSPATDVGTMPRLIERS